MRLTNCTITQNTGGGGSVAGVEAGGSTTVRNSIIAGNLLTNTDVKGTFTSQGHNLIGNPGSAIGFTNGSNGDQVGTVGSPLDPLLAPLANNGGPTLTHALLLGSRTLDAGDDCVTQVAHCSDANIPQLTTDQRGSVFNRIVDGPDADTTATVDIGAFEAQVSIEDIPNKASNEDAQLQFTFNVGGSGSITSITATSSNTALVPNNAANIAVTGSGPTRTLTINPVPDQSGTSTITITVNGTNSQSMTDTFVLTVNSVNDAPSFTEGPNQTVNNTAGAQTVNNWATSILPGPADESGQTVSFQVTANSNPSLFTVAPAVGSNGTLTYTPAANAAGLATITIVLQDNGGTANGGQNTSPSRSFSILTNAAGGMFDFSSSTYNTTEGSGFTTISVIRNGELSQFATVDYATSADSGLPCSNVSGVASPKCDFTAALGTLKFFAGENSKTFTVLINQDSFVEGTETFTVTLSNSTAGAVLVSPTTATVTITDDLTKPNTNAIDDAGNFVRQNYHDFLNREPDASGLAFWTNEITSCGSDAACIERKRINVSAAFFLSIEFQGTGYLVERMYKTAYGDLNGTSTFGPPHQLPVPIVRFNEFLPDTQEIGQGVVVGQTGWDGVLENNKLAFTAEFVQRPRFTTAYPLSMTPDQFVDQLNTRAGNVLSPGERTTAVGLFGSATNTSSVTARAQALRQIAEDADLNSAESNRAFVLMQFFGFLRRNPNDPQDTDYTGYDFWLTKLNQFNGNFVDADMVKAFITAGEYRQRFGP